MVEEEVMMVVVETVMVEVVEEEVMVEEIYKTFCKFPPNLKPQLS